MWIIAGAIVLAAIIVYRGLALVARRLLHIGALIEHAGIRRAALDGEPPDDALEAARNEYTEFAARLMRLQGRHDD